MERSKKKIFITGATGFIGRHLLLSDKLKAYDVFILSRKKAPETTEHTWIEGDLARPESYKKYLVQCDFLLHMAGEKKDESQMEEVNVGGMKILLGLHRESPTFKIIYVSSSGVYGIEHHPKTELSENDDCFPDTAYEKSKLKAELLLQTYAADQQIEYTVLRPSNIIGTLANPPKLLNLMQAVKRNRIFAYSSKAMVNYVDADFLSDIIFELFEKSKLNNAIYNVNCPMLLSDLLKMIASELKMQLPGRKVPTFLLKPLAIAGDLLPSRIAYFNSLKLKALTNQKFYSIRRLEQEFQSDAHEAFKKGITKLIAHYQSLNLL